MGGVETACKGKKYHHLAKLLFNMDPSLLHSCKTANILNIKYLLLSDTPTFPRLSSSSLRLSSGPLTLMEMGQLVSEKRQKLELEQKHCDSSQENFTLRNTILLLYHRKAFLQNKFGFLTALKNFSAQCNLFLSTGLEEFRYDCVSRMAYPAVEVHNTMRRHQNRP